MGKNLFLNVGTGKDITLKELATLISEIVSFKGNIYWDTTNLTVLKKIT